MPELHIFTDPETARDDITQQHLAALHVVDVTDEPVRWTAVRIPQGTTGGSSSVLFYLMLPDKTLFIAQTTAALIEMLAGALRGADERDAGAKR